MTEKQRNGRLLPHKVCIRISGDHSFYYYWRLLAQIQSLNE